MSIRIRTSQDGEKIILRLQIALEGRSASSTRKWQFLRLAMSVSLRLPVQPGELAVYLRQKDRGNGSEYRLQQVTGEGKKGRKGDDDYELDITDTMKAMLSVLHDVDLFRPDRLDDFQHLLEYHLERGLREIQARWPADADLYSTLLELLSPGHEVLNPTQAAPGVDAMRLAFEELGLKVQVQEDIRHGPRISRYRVVLAQLKDWDRLSAGLSKLTWALNIAQGAIQVTRAENKVVMLDVPRPRESWRSPGLRELKVWTGESGSEDSLIVCPGVDAMGTPYWLDLSRAPHVFVAGTTGSGKSACLHSMLCSLLLRLDPAVLQLVLIDPKLVEFKVYNQIPHIRSAKRILTDEAGIRTALEELCAEMETRYEQMESWGVRNVEEARAQGHQVPWIVVAIDELADFLYQAPLAEEMLARLAQKSRACGIHLLLSTQRPDSRTFSGILRTNVPVRIALAVQRASESRIILDEGGAESLLRPGDMLVRGNTPGLTRLHGFDLKPDEIAHVVRLSNRKGKEP